MSRRRRFQGVTGYVGMPGSGKTYSLASVGLAAMRRGEPVFCNKGFDLAGAETFSGFDEFCAIESGIVVWDELPLYVNARKWQEFPDGLLYKLTQIRKDSVTLYYSAIHEQMIDVNLRRITFNYWHCRGLSARFFKRALFPPEQFRKANQKALRTEYVRVRPAVFTAYDTYGKVAAPTTVTDLGKKREWVNLGRNADAGGGAPLGVPPAVEPVPGDISA